MGHPRRSLEDESVESHMDRTIEAQLKRSLGSEGWVIIATGLETILVVFWKRMCLVFALVLRINLRLLKNFGLISMAEEISR